jgi:hypothetical protein
MANNFGRVNVSISASTGGLTAGLGRARKALSGFSSAASVLKSPLSMLGSVAKSTFGQLALFSAARGAVSTLTGMASGAAESVDQLSKLSRRLGTTYSELAGLKLAGDLAGVGIDEIGKAMTKADVALVNARNGSKKASAAFATLGLTAEQLAGMGSADRFEAIASAIAKLPDSSSRAAAAIALFGKSGAEILPLFEGGADGIRQAREEAQKLGLALTGPQGQAVEEMNDSFTRVYYAIQGVIQQVTAKLAPAITGIATKFTDFVKNTGGVNIGTSIGKAIIEGAKYLATVADMVVSQFRQLYFKVADALGVATSKEAKRLSEMQALVNAGTAPQVAVEGSGGFVTQLDPKFAAELSDLTKAVQMQREEVFPFAQLVADAEKAIIRLGNMPDSAPPPLPLPKPDASPPPKPTPKPIAQLVKISSQDLKAIVSGTSDAESFRNALARGADPRLDTKDEQRRTADATERSADAMEEFARTGGFGVATIA